MKPPLDTEMEKRKAAVLMARATQEEREKIREDFLRERIRTCGQSGHVLVQSYSEWRCIGCGGSRSEIKKLDHKRTLIR